MKKFTLSIISLLTVFFCTNCNSGTTPDLEKNSNPEVKSVDISVVTSYGGDDGNRLNYENAVKNYEMVTGNTVQDRSGISNEEWKAEVMAYFENGNEPDVLFYFTGADSNKFIEDNKVVSLEEIISVYPDYASNMKESMLSKSAVDNKSYAVPVNGFWEGLFVNKKILSKCGVEIPNENTTWEQFIDACRKIADKGYVPIAASLNEVPHYWFEYCVFNNGSLNSHLEFPKSSNDIIGKNWINGINDIKTMYDNGFFPDDTLSITGAQADRLMIEGNAAFMIEGSWKMGWFAENASDINNFTVTYVPGKGERSSAEIIGGISMGYFITRKAWDNPDKREACVKFITAMTSDEVVRTFGVTAMTALKNNITPPSDANNLVKDALKMTANYTGIVTAAADGLTSDVRAELFAQIKNAVTEEITAEEIIDNCFAK